MKKWKNGEMQQWKNGVGITTGHSGPRTKHETLRTLPLRRHFSDTILEMMDRPGIDRELLEDDLLNLRVINRRFGGLSALRRAVMPMALRNGSKEPVTILDLATGSGDQPVELYKACQREGKGVRITAVDQNGVMLTEARKLAAGIGEIEFVKGDILNLPFRSESYDIVSCSLAIHHLSHENAVKLLREMCRLCRIGFVVNDLSRSLVAAAAAWVYTRLATKNPITRYDSVLSILRAFTKKELASIAREAGIGRMDIYTAPLFRLLAVKVK